MDGALRRAGANGGFIDVFALFCALDTPKVLDTIDRTQQKFDEVTLGARDPRFGRHAIVNPRRLAYRAGTADHWVGEHCDPGELLRRPR
jgi:hypothetical protein